MSLHPIHSFLFCAVFGLAVVGCSSESEQATVEGTVTLDGQPLESGLIRFAPVDGQTPTADAAITQGKYSAKVPPGEKRVSITAPKVVGKQKMYDTPDSPMVDVIRELLPARYNARSELSLTVEPGTQNPEFELQSR